MSMLRRMCSAVAVMAVLLPVAVAHSAHAQPKSPGLTSVFYSRTVALHTVDGNSAGIDHGDLFHREQALSRTPGGPVIGVGYSQAEVVSHHVQDNVDVRRVTIENRLPKGELYVMGLTELTRGTTPRPGWTDTYAVIGGTGRYAGAQGTYVLQLMPDGTTFKVTVRLAVP